MKIRLYILILTAFFCIFSFTGCSKAETVYATNNEVSAYSEELIEIDFPVNLEIINDSGNIDIFTWSNNQIKFEILRRIRGVHEKDILDKEISKIGINVYEKEGKIVFESYYKEKNKGIKNVSVDIKVYIPKSSAVIGCKLKKGNIKVLDDIKGIFNAELDTVNVEINKFSGQLEITCKNGNIDIKGGRLSGNSQVLNEKGNINIKAEFDQNGEYIFDTQMGNISLRLSENSLKKVESKDIIYTDDSGKLELPDNIKLNSGIGRITVDIF